MIVRIALVAIFYTTSLSLPALAGDSQFGSNGTNVPIPDAGSFVASTISITGAPAGAVVTGIDVHFSCIHPYSGDLNIDLNADAQGNLGNYDIWEREGGSADNPSRTVFGINTFNGLSVNRTWYLYARDEEAGDAGFIDEWWIRVYYESPTTPSIANVDPNPVVGSNSPQPFTILGSNFVSGATVTLRDKSTGEVFPDRPISSQSGTHITINPNFTTAAAEWSVEVINPGPASSGEFFFDVIAPSTTPSIADVDPNPVVGSNSPQPFTILGSNFVSGATVTLRDTSTGEVFPDRPISSQSGTHITINPNFTTAAAEWSVEVINPGPASSGEFFFDVIAPSTTPSIADVDPNPVVGSNSPQPFTVLGSNFVSGATVTLRDTSTGEVFPDRPISSQSATHITINPNFTTAAAEWSVEVINPGPASSGEFFFDVIAPDIQTVISPVIGSLRVTGLENPTCFNHPTLWTFCQHQSGLHVPGGGIADADETLAWDLNLTGDGDEGERVFPVAAGIVVRYGGLHLPGAVSGAVLIEHETGGETWWSGYLHMEDIVVSLDQNVTPSTVLGKVGDASDSEPVPNHLHLVIYGGSNTQAGLVSRDASFLETSPVIFQDGFESGDLSEWTVFE